LEAGKVDSNVPKQLPVASIIAPYREINSDPLLLIANPQHLQSAGLCFWPAQSRTLSDTAVIVMLCHCNARRSSTTHRVDGLRHQSGR
jgi:hypothetical protein